MILDCTKHNHSVKLFSDHFKIRPQRPELTYLNRILENFSTIPYENISKIIKLNEHWNSDDRFRFPEEVISDFREWRLGGTCFSLTFFLQSILVQNGFTCYPVMADMRAGKNIHCALIVCLQKQKYLVDPGYLLNQPMLIDPHHPRHYKNECTGVELRYLPQEVCYHLFTFNWQELKWRYRFFDRPTPAQEFLQHWQASFKRNSMHGICLTKVQKDGLIYIHKNFMRETNRSSKKNTNIRHNYHRTIQSIFGINEQWVDRALAALALNMKRERQTKILNQSESRV